MSCDDPRKIVKGLRTFGTPVTLLSAVVFAMVAALLVFPNKAVAAPAALPILAEQPEPPLREPFPRGTLLTLDAAPGALAVQPDGKVLAGSALGGWFVDEQSGVVGW